MKKQLLLVCGLCMLVAFTGCKSSKESAYKAAYEKAKTAETEQGQAVSDEPVEITPIVSTTTTQTPAVDESFRSEKVVLTSGATGSLKAYSVVCGSFSVKANAEGLKDNLEKEGYKALVVQNPATKMYRVVCGSYDNKTQAAQAKEQFKAKHTDNKEFQKSWLLYNN